ncbi:MAG TPA: DUF1987 domain-containing protein [Crocinitomix sp.]|nr:DUF1987 domain-containing protein [Crocinitomix sp.]
MMALQIAPTIKTPGIKFNPEEGFISITGISIPEDTQDFFAPLHTELQKYLANPAKETILEFRLEYFNTSSTLIIRDLIRKLRTINNKTDLKVKWCFEFEDEDMKDAGEEFKMLFDDIKFEIIGVKNL